MSKELYYRQCFLEKQLEDGVKKQVSYLPERFAFHQGPLTLLIDKENDIWEDGWVVKGYGDPQLADVVEERGRDYTNTRKASDI